MLLNIYFYFLKYLRVSVDIKKLCGYSHNGYPTPTLLPAGRVWETYYSYPTRPANISNFTCFEKNV